MTDMSPTGLIEDRSTSEASRKGASPARLVGLIAVGLALVGGAVVIGIGPRRDRRSAVEDVSRAALAPKAVRVARVMAGSATADLALPATALPFRSTTLYAKSSGFLRVNRVEVGDHVKARAVLAEVDAPETDQDLRLAEARLEEAQANVVIVQQTAERNRGLAAQGVVSQQAADDTRAQANSSHATVKARRADLRRLRAVRGYQEVIAPFDGVITKRNVDPGALVGPAGAGSVALFEIAQVTPLRIFLDVPQSLASGIKPGLDAQVYAPSTPTKIATGKVVRTSTVLDQGTRTLKTEVQLPESGPILPGAFVYVKIKVPRADPPPLVTATALLIRKEGTLVAKVEGGRAKLVSVLVTRDLGKDVELGSGVVPGDEVIVNAPDDLEEGAPVNVVMDKRDGG